MSGDPAPRPKKVLSYSLSRQIRSEDPRPLEAVSAGFALPVPLPRRAAGWQPSQARLPSHTGHLFARTAPAVSPPSAWSQPSGHPPSAPSRRAVGRSFRPTGPCPLSPLFPLFLAAFRPLSTCCPPCSSPNPLLRRPPQVRPPALPLSWTAVVGTHAFLLEALGQRPGAPDSWVRFGNHVVVFTEF